MRADGGASIYQEEVKFMNLLRTNCSVSIHQVRFCRLRARVGGSKMIRYRCSPDIKRCDFFWFVDLFQLITFEKSKTLHSVGSMVARLKLKRIDGRAPPEMELAA